MLNQSISYIHFIKEESCGAEGLGYGKEHGIPTM